MYKAKTLTALIVAALLLTITTACSVQTGQVSQKGEQKVDGSTQQEKTNNDNPDQVPQEPLGSKEETPQESKNENTLYVSVNQVNVQKDASGTAEKVDALKKGTSVQLVEEKKDEQNASWSKIEYENATGKVSGWILSQYTVKDRTELLDASLKNLDYSPQPKVKEYPENPRVKAKGIYLTIYSAGGKRLDKLIEMAKRTKINTFVIDVKDDKGYMLFHTKAAEKYAPEANKYNTVKDIGALIKKLKENNIYAIARIVSFKDPVYITAHPDRAIVYRNSGKPFTNSDKLAWATAYDRQLWDYNIAVAKEAAEAGFNEIQFDYVRFPASNGGKLDKDLDYRNTKNEPKPKAIQEYLKAAHKELSPLKVYVSADIYGLVGSVNNDMSLGQYWEAVSNVVDYVSPMMYPSHYANETYGLSIPDAYPYETILRSTKNSIERNRNIPTPATIRPWIQDFTAAWVKGHISYNEKEVRAQIKALEENGVDEFLLWNAANSYTEEAVK